MVDAIVSTVINQLATIVQQETEQGVRLVVGVDKDVEKLICTFTNIEVVLKDAKMKQIMDDSVGVWLQDLKDVAYDIDDVLDEWLTAILKSQLEPQVHHDEHGAMKVCYSFCNLFSFKRHRIGLRHEIGPRIKDINERLDQIARDQTKLGFIRNDPTSGNYEIIDDEWSRKRRILETSSFDVDDKGVFGRDMDRNTIISKLLSEGSQQEVVVSGIPIISIVGMPGLGKTTLAQIVFNDDRVNNHFIERMWIHVSKPFDRVKVALIIIREMGGNINDITQGVSGHDVSWQAVQCQLTKSIMGKKFLLVLDDVWNEDPILWDPLKISLQRASQEGSRILVTTRNENVARIMGTTYVHRLGLLSNQECWSLLSHSAFVGRENEECEKLKEIGMELADKCHGLPLSAKTLGSLLCVKNSKQDWQRVLESDVWRVVSTVDQPILSALMLSYNDLPSHLKQCFAYCSFNPRGYLIGKNLMVKEWMAQGYLSDSLVGNDEDLIAIGDEYFNNLVLRSLLEKDVEQSRGSLRQYYKMHDLVYDFAKSLVEKECFNLTIKDTNAQEFNFIRARHLYLKIKEIEAIPSFIYKAKNVRTLQIKGYIPSVSSELFHHLKCLRTLDLSETGLEELPNEIEKLIHLRWLNLSCTMLQELPNTVTNLYNLKALHLCACINLRKLPEGIERLVNLIELDFSEGRQISYLPEGIGKLTKLRGLSNFIIDGVERGGCTIRELRDLNLLKGLLRIIGLGRVENGNEAKMARLKDKQHLRALYFCFNQYTGFSLVDDDVIDGEADNKEEEKEEIIDEEGKTEEVVDVEGKTTEEEEEEEEEAIGGEDTSSRRMEGVLESLRPHPNLEKLIIRDYVGTVLPNWIVSHADFMSFSNLNFLELGGWRKCKQLPATLGKLPSLETLVIAKMDKVKFMDIEFFGIDGATTSDGRVDTIFPKLKVFQLDEMLNLEEWDMRVQKEDGKDFIFMPCLQCLVLCECPKLRSFPQHLTHAAALRKLFIWDCPKLSWMPFPSSHLIPFQSIEELILKEDAGSFSKSLLANSHMLLPKLKLLRVRESPYSSLPQGLGQLASLEILDIRTCSKIKSIPEGEFQHLTALKELRIIRCPALRRSCEKDIGEDWSKISHIPKIFID